MSHRIGEPGYRSRYGFIGGQIGKRRAGRWFWIGSAAWVAVVLALVWWVT